ncbi:alpha/beta fold hydrolase [Polynucleobacter sp. AM-25C3]|uniref:alpha/beta fold hydrolase n=1 Tax=Polynucleobacter sp. AM-25C3 TaxID=1855569 RepID=UPI001C0B87C4|nr:alpha/beta hydrolase [Polynucleobacter sp. AM-25C3]MBU3600777.1 alpha/beta hydrolase [Polynucleobacter sp. AM-25C3]
MNTLFAKLIQCFAIIFMLLATAKAEPLLGAPCAIEVESKQVGAGSIEYMKAGGGTPVVLLHGLFAQKEQWIEVTCKLSSAGFMVFAPDLPGYGKSIDFPVEDYRLENQVGLLHRFIDLLELRKIHIAGSSMGGAIASMYVNKYPGQVYSLAFVGSPLGIGPWGVKVKDALSQGINPFIPITIDQFNLEMELLFYKPPEVPETIRDQLLTDYQQSNQHYQQVWNIVNLYMNQITKSSPARIPTFIIWGKQDEIFTVGGVGALQLKYPGNQHYIMPDAGHLLMLEKPKEVSLRYIGFLKRR